MKRKQLFFYVIAIVLFQLVALQTAMADDADVSDIALTPGADQSQLNITWYSGNATAGEECSVEVTKNPFKKKAHFFFSFLPGFSRTYSGEWVQAPQDENGEDECYCKVTVDQLKKYEKYTYTVSDGSGEWSDAYDYVPGDMKEVGFFFVADSQIGASGGGELSRSRDGQPYITAYFEENEVPSPEKIKGYLESVNPYNAEETELYSDLDTYDEYIAALLAAVNTDIAGYIYDSASSAGTITEYLEYINPYDDEETELYSDLETYAEYITGLLAAINEDIVSYIYNPVFYDEYSDEGMDCDFSDVALLDEGLAAGLLELIEGIIADNIVAVDDDSAGWVTTVDLMTDMFPMASLIIAGGDQVEQKTDEYEYTGFFAPEELKSIPVAPTYASHDRAANFEYHFTLPNESTAYGVDSNGVGDYYFTSGDALIMVLNMDVTNNLFPREEGGGPPPGGGGGPSTDSDGDGVSDDEDTCADTPEDTFVDEYGCALVDGEDYDGDGVLNEEDDCSNSLSGHIEAGLISAIDGCPYDDYDNDGIPDVDNDGNIIDRCNNTDDDLTVDENGCADCDYLETDDELRTWLAELQETCEDVEVTDDDGNVLYDDDVAITETVCELDDFEVSLAEHQAFISESIEANPQTKWRIVVWHYSIYSAGNHSTDDASEGIRYLFTPMLEDLGIDVVLMGHDHVYTRTYQMLGNEPQTDQMVGPDGQVINPTGVLYLTESSSSGSKYYSLNCNFEDDTSSSYDYYNYAAVYRAKEPTFTYFSIDKNSLKLSSYTYSLDEETEEYVLELFDEYAIEKNPPFGKKGKQGKGQGK
jgi:hypothetical protein